MQISIHKNDLSPSAKSVYKALSELVDDSGSVIITRAELKRITGYKCKNSVRSGLVELENKGLIKIDRRDKNGFTLANNYRILKEAV